MKTIYLVRHAKAVKDEIMPDIERPLDDHGREEARRIVLEIKGGVIPDILISSPAVRALETAGIFAAELGYPPDKIARRKALYDQNANVFRAVLREMKDSCERIMLFGHNPSITDAARAFAPEFHDEIPTAGVVTIAFDITSWKEIADGRGTMKSVKYPGEEAKQKESFKHLKRDLSTRLTERMESVLMEFDREAAEEIRDNVHQAGEKIAGKFVKRLKAKEKKSKTQSPKSKDRNGKAEEECDI